MEEWDNIGYYMKINHAAQDLLNKRAGKLSESMSIVEAFKQASVEVRDLLKQSGALGFEESAE